MTAVTGAATRPGAAMVAEIDEQPTVLARLLDAAHDIAATRAQLLARHPRFVVLAARGSSDHAALYAKYLVETRLGLAAGLASPSSLTLYGARQDLRDVLFVAVSQSGGSPDLVESVQRARDFGAFTVAVTNTPDSTLAQAAHSHVDILAGREQAVAATKTYTAELLALYLLLVGENAAAVPDAAARTLALADQARDAAERYRFAQYLTTTARGYSYATAREAALKVMETSYLPAQAFSAADLLHGPLAMIDGNLPVIALTAGAVAGRAMRPVIERLVEAGADVLEIGGPGGLPIADEALPEELLPIIDVLPLQVLACRLAMARGLDPDRPRGLSKITQTW